MDGIELAILGRDIALPRKELLQVVGRDHCCYLGLRGGRCSSQQYSPFAGEFISRGFKEQSSRMSAEAQSGSFMIRGMIFLDNFGGATPCGAKQHFAFTCFATGQVAEDLLRRPIFRVEPAKEIKCSILTFGFSCLL